MSGPARTPNSILRMRGSRLVKDREDSPNPDAQCPEMPDALTGEALAEWNRVSAMMMDVGTLTQHDRAVLAGYCRAWADANEADAHVAEFGTLVGDGKNLGPNPNIKRAAEAWLRMLRFAQELGLTPASRSKVRVPKADKSASPAAQFFKASG